jgi:hypothetical protein
MNDIKDLDKAQKEAIDRYIAEFGELPPLNPSIPGKRDNK